MYLHSKHTVIDYFATPKSQDEKLKELVNIPTVEIESYGADEDVWFIKYSYYVNI